MTQPWKRDFDLSREITDHAAMIKEYYEYIAVAQSTLNNHLCNITSLELELQKLDATQTRSWKTRNRQKWNEKMLILDTIKQCEHCVTTLRTEMSINLHNMTHHQTVINNCMKELGFGI